MTFPPSVSLFRVRCAGRAFDVTTTRRARANRPHRLRLLTQHVRHVCHGRRGPGRPGTSAIALVSVVHRPDICKVLDSATTPIRVYVGAPYTKRYDVRDRFQRCSDMPPPPTTPTGHLRRQVRQGCQGPPLRGRHGGDRTYG